MKKLSLPSATTLIMLVIVLAAAATWVLPAGRYSQLAADGTGSFVVSSKDGSVSLPFTQRTLDSLSLNIPLSKFANGDIRKPVSVPGTYRREERRPQGPVAILQAPVRGIVDSIDIVLFILIIGGFMQVFNRSGALLAGVRFLASRMKGRERLLIVVLTCIFAFFGGSYGMDVESIVFYPVLVPLFVAAGYDALVPLAIVFGGASIGYISSFSNPFSTIIASNTLGISWLEGFRERVIFLVVATGLFIVYILRYAARVKRNPAASLAFRIDGLEAAPPIEPELPQPIEKAALSLRNGLLLLLFFLTFAGMITGIIFFGWWTTEMSALFLTSAILTAIIDRTGEKLFVSEFTQGMASLLSVALIVGLARGVTIVLNDGFVSDSILFHASNLVRGLPPSLFIVLTMAFYFLFTIPVTSSSGMAVLTMPIIGSLAVLLAIPGREIVNAYLFGIGAMYLITPTGSVFPALTMVNLSYKVWLKFILPFLVLLLVLSAVFLMVGIRI